MHCPMIKTTIRTLNNAVTLSVGYVNTIVNSGVMYVKLNFLSGIADSTTPPTHDPSLQLESGDYVLLENGDRRLLG